MAVLIAVFAAGVVRGFSGFGAGMIVVPVAAAAYSPQHAVVVFLVLDTLPALPLVIPTLRKVSLAELAPVVAGYACLLPLGIWFLKTGDTGVLRWCMSAVIILAAVCLWSGWKYTGPRSLAVRAGVGGLAGFLGGSMGVPGPPVVLYWMAQSNGAGFVRAHLIVFLTVAQWFAGIGLISAGLVTREALTLGFISAPLFLVALLIGARMFGQATETAYRRIAFGIIITAAVLTLPALDMLRG
ncbi:TSUP family transporter [Oricola sp.]|uniref:TSUP family transporter n=1 Tax=Oricola sp. TaxID=1979950 RepID=UPI003BABC096